MEDKKQRKKINFKEKKLRNKAEQAKWTKVQANKALRQTVDAGVHNQLHFQDSFGFFQLNLNYLLSATQIHEYCEASVLWMPRHT